MEDNTIKKWLWMVNYCEKMRWSPWDSTLWNLAEEAYNKEVRELG